MVMYKIDRRRGDGRGLKTNFEEMNYFWIFKDVEGNFLNLII